MNYYFYKFIIIVAFKLHLAMTSTGRQMAGSGA